MTDTRFRKIQRWLGGRLQIVVWWLTDGHDAWLITYPGGPGEWFTMVRTCHYLMARRIASECKGRIDGVCRAVIEA